MKDKPPRGRSGRGASGYKPGERRLPRHHSAAERGVRDERFVSPSAPQKGKRARELVLDLFARARLDWSFAERRMSAALRREPGLRDEDRRAAAAILRGMMRNLRRIDFALEAAKIKLPPDSRRELARYVAYMLLARAMDIPEAELHLAGFAWNEVLAVDAHIGKVRGEAHRLALAYSLPDWLAEQLLRDFPTEANAVAASLNTDPPLTLRTNTLVLTRDALLERLRKDKLEARPASHASNAVVLPPDTDVATLLALRDDQCTQENESLQLVTQLVAPPAGALIADVCAGHGDAILALAADLHNRGHLIATDTDDKPLEELRRRARRRGITSIQAVVSKPTQWADALLVQVGKFDRVLVTPRGDDLGRMREHPELRYRVSEEDLAASASTHEALLTRALELVAKGGRLVYATSALLCGEYEGMISRLLRRNPSFELVPARSILGDGLSTVCSDDGRFLRTLPHRHGLDGCFAVVLQRATT